jgi:GNAT superfamily N-acetyltransferase
VSAALPASAGPPIEGWTVRRADRDDVEAVVTAVSALLRELNGKRPPRDAMRAAAETLVEDEQAGLILLCESESGALVGVLAASWQAAIHAGGRYGLVQDLWVDVAWRGRAVGSGLLDALRRAALRREILRVEVGLPRESFARIGRTSAFYRSNGFEPVGARMRLTLT